MNNYENAEPKILKTLNSSGEVLDDSGNIIADTSDYWVKTYNQAEPKSDKILHSDGTIKDSAGNLIQDTTPFNVKKYNQAEPIPAKYLHSDGTIDENPGGGSVTVYDWLQGPYHYYLPFEIAPESLSMEELRAIEYLQILNDEEIEKTTLGEAWSALEYHKVSDTEFTFRSFSNTITVTRASAPNDITIW